MIRVASGWSPKGRTLYGHKFLASFDKFWPAEVELQVYTEEPEPMPRDACRSLWDIPGARELNAALKDDPARNGRDPTVGRWKANCLEIGYNFRFDISKFWKQLAIPTGAMQGLAENDVLIWLDGDVVTTAPVTEQKMLRIVGDRDVTFLGRPKTYSEIGMWAVRINPRTIAFINELRRMLVSGDYLNLSEHHSAWIFDDCRKRSGMSENNLTPNGRGHVFPVSPLAKILTHNKGKLKGVEK